MAFFSNKSLLSEAQTEFLAAMKSSLSSQPGKVIEVSALNELARQANCWEVAYYAMQGFNSSDKKAVNELSLREDYLIILKKITDKQWAEELTASTSKKSLLNQLVSSKERYLNLYIKPTPWLISKKQAQTALPETTTYKKDKATGVFVLETLDQLLFVSYRLDLAQHQNLEEENLSLNELQPPSLLLPVATLVSRIASKDVAELDLQYIFTWLLQYAATITAVSTLYASYNTALLPAEVVDQTRGIIEKLVKEVSTVELKTTSVEDPLALSQQLLKQIPALYEEANQKMTALDHQLLFQDTDQPKDLLP